MSIQALYIDPRGPYPALLGPENCWDIARDARLYNGPWPVVAHPPCGPWGRLRHLYRGAEHDCAPRAVAQVRAFGGVLEHPANSRLWTNGHSCQGWKEHCDHCEGGDGPCCVCGWEHLPLPDHAADSHGGYTVAVNQCDWGHVARKATWLYIVGCPRSELPPFPEPREPTHWISGGRGRAGKKAKTTPVPPGIKICSAQQRRRTPLAFAEWLIAIARRCELREAT